MLLQDNFLGLKVSVLSEIRLLFLGILGTVLCIQTTKSKLLILELKNLRDFYNHIRKEE